MFVRTPAKHLLSVHIRAKVLQELMVTESFFGCGVPLMNL